MAKRQKEIEYDNFDVIELIMTYIHNIKVRAILRARLVDGLTFEELAQKFNYSPQQIKRIVYKGQEEIFKHLK